MGGDHQNDSMDESGRAYMMLLAAQHRRREKNFFSYGISCSDKGKKGRRISLFPNKEGIIPSGAANNYQQQARQTLLAATILLPSHGGEGFCGSIRARG